MLYRVESGGFTKIDSLSLNENNIQLGCLTKEEFQRFLDSQNVEGSSDYLFDTNEVQNSLQISEYDSFAVVNLIDVSDIRDEERDQIVFYFRRNMFLVVVIRDENNNVKDIWQNSLGSVGRVGVPIGKYFANFLKLLISNHKQLQYNIQLQIEELDQRVLEDMEKSDTPQKVSELNHQLLTLYGYYDQIVDLLESLIDNDNGILKSSDIKYIKTIFRRVDRFLDNIKLLREYLVQVRESYQAQLDLGLNRVMKILTVVTAVFLPLTLLVGWYGMNFKNMPELTWTFGYPLVFILSGLIIIISIILFKRNRML
ncbi:MAG: magnesium transporter [Ruminococcaceae bacterium]|nr:magnesium transporter [Oscillospiraceae bacterium]